MKEKTRIRMMFVMWLFSAGITLFNCTEVPKFNFFMLLLCYFCELGIQYSKEKEQDNDK